MYFFFVCVYSFLTWTVLLIFLLLVFYLGYTSSFDGKANRNMLQISERMYKKNNIRNVYSINIIWLFFITKKKKELVLLHSHRLLSPAICQNSILWATHPSNATYFKHCHGILWSAHIKFHLGYLSIVREINQNFV